MKAEKGGGVYPVPKRKQNYVLERQYFTFIALKFLYPLSKPHMQYSLTSHKA
jgi:hypothetical protein